MQSRAVETARLCGSSSSDTGGRNLITGRDFPQHCAVATLAARREVLAMSFGCKTVLFCALLAGLFGAGCASASRPTPMPSTVEPPDHADAGSAEKDAGRAEAKDAGRAEAKDAGRAEAKDAGIAEAKDAGIAEAKDAGSAEAKDAGIAEQDAGSVDQGLPLVPGLIQFSPMYSAYDGEHVYQLSPFLPGADPKNKDADPIVESSIVWTVDDAFVKKEAFFEIPGAILLTTKKAGSTVVKVSATRFSGLKVRGQSMLSISQSDPSEWFKGATRYNNGMMVNFFATGPCGLPIDLTGRIPTNSACSNCHNNMGGLVVEHSPTQTAGYSDDELIEIFTNALKPSAGFNSPLLRTSPMPDCIYRNFHTWQIDEDTKRGIVWKLRSITPKHHPEIDVTRIAMQAAAARRMNGAAGSGAP